MLASTFYRKLAFFNKFLLDKFFTIIFLSLIKLVLVIKYMRRCFKNDLKFLLTAT
jgi:hypothetical protein